MNKYEQGFMKSSGYCVSRRCILNGFCFSFITFPTLVTRQLKGFSMAAVNFGISKRGKRTSIHLSYEYWRIRENVEGWTERYCTASHCSKYHAVRGKAWLLTTHRRLPHLRPVTRTQSQQQQSKHRKPLAK